MSRINELIPILERYKALEIDRQIDYEKFYL